MRLAERIYLVGSGRNGFGMSDRFDCHVYLLDGASELALIDCGAGMGLDQILANVRADGLDPGRVKQLILTHAHGDHAGGAARVKSTLDVKIASSSEAARWLRDGDEDAISLGAAKRAGIYPSDYRLEPCPIDVEVGDGDRIRVGDLELLVYDSPGHALGHRSYLLNEPGRRFLFAGDAIFAGGRVVLQTTWDCSIQQSVATIQKLAGLQADALLAGHGALVLADAAHHFALASAWIDRLLPPPQLTL
ncbi:MAG: MBL fold metallo-hydrolase [Chloroflexota bacterium]